METKIVYAITPKKLGNDTLYTARVEALDPSGVVLVSEKRSFRNDEEAAVKFATKPREVKSRVLEGNDRAGKTTARDSDPRTEYYFVDAKASAK